MILCFSGNGNSAMVARLLSSHLGDEVTMLRARLVNNPGEAHFGKDVGRVVWVLPVHSWGIPVAVKRFIKALGNHAFSSTTLHHLVLTCGDDCGKAHRMWRNVIEGSRMADGRVSLGADAQHLHAAAGI